MNYLPLLEKMSYLALLATRLMPWVFGFGIVANTLLSLIPTTAIPEVFNFWDKAQHSISFTILALIGCLAYPKKWRTVCIGLIAYGAAIEIMQATLTTTRFGDVADFIADGIGVVIGISVHAVFIRIYNIRR
ncbi:MAG: VanZ family protein [Desulfamplus sp.]|nr:VanZ family protein [Desulfamplus sp.]